MTYAVVWRENEGEPYAGELALDPDSVVLTGAASGTRESLRRLRYDSLADARLERRQGLLLVLLDPSGNRVEVASLEGAGVLHELAERIFAGLGKPAG